MRRLGLHYILGLVIILLSAGSSLAQSEIGNLITSIKEAQKVENLYTVRYNLNNIREKGELNLNEKRELLNAYRLLTDAFRSRNHFRNADIVYLDYIGLQKEFHKEYSSFLADSVHKSNESELNGLKAKSTELDQKIKILEEKQAVISGMKTKYFSFSIIATIIILILFAIVLIRKTRSISAARAVIEKDRKQIESLFQKQVEASIAEGAINYAKFAAADEVGYIDEIKSYFDLETDLKVKEEAVKALDKYRDLLQR